MVLDVDGHDDDGVGEKEADADDVVDNTGDRWQIGDTDGDDVDDVDKEDDWIMIKLTTTTMIMPVMIKMMMIRRRSR